MNTPQRVAIGAYLAVVAALVISVVVTAVQDWRRQLAQDAASRQRFDRQAARRRDATITRRPRGGDDHAA